MQKLLDSQNYLKANNCHKNKFGDGYADTQRKMLQKTMICEQAEDVICLTRCALSVTFWEIEICCGGKQVKVEISSAKIYGGRKHLRMIAHRVDSDA